MRMRHRSRQHLDRGGRRGVAAIANRRRCLNWCRRRCNPRCSRSSGSDRQSGKNYETFKKIESDSIVLMAADENLGRDANAFFNRLCEYKYSYHFDWLGRPIIQFPQGIGALWAHDYWNAPVWRSAFGTGNAA